MARTGARSWVFPFQLDGKRTLRRYERGSSREAHGRSVRWRAMRPRELNRTLIS
jgi:hypothetical protein